MSRINSNWYTKGKFDRKNWRNTIDTENEFLYSKGRYPTKIKEEDLPKDYTEVRSRTIWYMKGFVKTSGVKDLYYTYIKENHLFKDDYFRLLTKSRFVSGLFTFSKNFNNIFEFFLYFLIFIFFEGEYVDYAATFVSFLAIFFIFWAAQISHV